jgi:putative membrane protein
MSVDVLRLRRGEVPALLAVAAVALQIGYPLASGAARDRLIVAIVLAFAAASATHAVLTRGWRVGGSAIAAAASIGFAAEVVGVHSGVPFGEYRYGTTLGPRLLAVPVVVAAAWTMLAWPAALAARRLARGRLARVLVGAWALAAWDLYLDPQMVAAGAWHWRDPGPHLPGVPEVPLSNYAGWLLVALVVSATVQWRLGSNTAPAPAAAGRDAPALALYLWTWVGSAVALAAFLGHPAAAAWGALGMGAVAVPLLRTLRKPSPVSP